jgi:hypothetical protein
MTGTAEVAWLAGLILLLGVMRKISMPVCVGSEPAINGVENIELKHLSQLWTEKDQKRVISLAELSRNWREEAAPLAAAVERPKPVYRHPDIADFYQARVEGKANMKEQVLDCIEALLRKLDEEGECPSVVSRNENEVEAKLEANVFDRLAELPLYRHALNVAEEMANQCKDELLAPMAIITGLAHDLGKIPAYQAVFYVTGDHPLIAQTVLEKVDPFGKLTYAGEVLDAILQHHRAQPESELGKKLKNADQACRNREIAKLLGPTGENKTVEKEETAPSVVEAPVPAVTVDEAVPAPASLPPPEAPADKDAKQETAAANAAVFGGYLDQDRDIFGATRGQEDHVENSLVPIDWFDPAATLSYIRQFINRTKGGRFFVFSMPDGTIYVQVGFFWKAAKRLSGNDYGLLAADADIQARRDIMFTMVERLKERKAIATDLLGPGYFMAPFIINPKSEDPREQNLIPFRVEAFGELISNLEAKKVHCLKEIKQVVAKHLMEKVESPLG